MASENEDLSPDPAGVAAMVRAAVQRSREFARSTGLLLDKVTFCAGIDRVDFNDGSKQAAEQGGTLRPPAPTSTQS